MDLDCIVIGAGQSGLGVSRELARRGFEHLLLEQGRVGESWRCQRWDSPALNSPAWMNALPGDGATAVPGLFVVGQSWLRTRRSGTISGVAADAPHVADLVAGHLGTSLQVAA